jgi:protoheme IX farnesyltransferase
MNLAGSTPDELLAVRPGLVKRPLGALYLELTKARLSVLVLLTTAVGFVVAARVTGMGSIAWGRLLWTIAGTALAAGCANAVNQIIEVRRDALMRRTCGRPMPSGALGLAHGLVAAVLMGYVGLVILAVFVSLAAASLALLTILIYVFAYTPLKPRTSLNTLVGAVCGALPPMIGWVAAAGSVGTGAWILAMLLFVWQIPHFLALAWLYRDDYARGGFAMLPVLDHSGRLTGQVVLTSSLLLIPLGLTATLAGLAGWIYTSGGVLLGLWLSVLGYRLYANHTDANARRLFRASIIYLPVLLCLLALDGEPVVGATAVAAPSPGYGPEGSLFVLAEPAP